MSKLDLRLVALVALGLFGAARDASAQEPETEAVSNEAPPKVRVRVKLQREGELADVFVERRGAWTFECRAPCTFDATAGERGRIEVLGTTDEPITFTVPAGVTGEHDIEVGQRGHGVLVGGLIAIGAGALSLALGMAIIRGAGKDDLFGEANGAMGRILLLLGGGSAVTGTVLIVTRSTAHVVMPSVPTRSQAHDDIAPSRSAEASRLPIPPLPLSLVWTGRF